MLRPILFALALTLTAPLAQAERRSAEVFIAETAESAARSGGPELSRFVMDRLDVRRIARFSLGRYGRSVSADDYQRFEAAFENYLLRQLDDGAGLFDGVQTEIVTSVERSAGDVIVTTRVRLEQEGPQTVRWRTLDRGDGWRIVDVEVAGLWLAVEQRAQFAAILNRRGATIDDVIASLGGVEVARLER